MFPICRFQSRCATDPPRSGTWPVRRLTERRRGRVRAADGESGRSGSGGRWRFVAVGGRWGQASRWDRLATTTQEPFRISIIMNPTLRNALKATIARPRTMLSERETPTPRRQKKLLTLFRAGIRANSETKSEGDRDEKILRKADIGKPKL